MEITWWKETVVYQVYPRSFKDSDGDGIGDLRGIIEKLDYIRDLGVGVIWLSPVYKSPNTDNGYDISDYRAIMPEFGNMDDFDALLRGAHERGLRIVMDLVVNHTSDEHEWFAESRSSKDNPRRDYYIWRDGVNGGEPNNWASFYSPSAWELDPRTGQYYLHYFAVKQPDLNWESREMREEVYDMMRFWLDKGIDGFRCDVINATKKPAGLPSSEKPANTASGRVFDMDMMFNNPGQAELIREIARNTLARYDVMSVGETCGATPENALDYVREGSGGLSMVFHFEIVDNKERWTLPFIKAVQRKWIGALHGKGWLSQYLSNHDQPRQVSIYGDDARYRVESAKLLATMIHTLPGTPYIYQGEEIGMTNTRFSSIDEINDIQSHHTYNEMTGRGAPPEEALAHLNRFSRDQARTPMPWDDTPGFTAGKPWLRYNPAFGEINVKAAMADPDSIYHHYKKLIALRKANPVMVYGDFEDLLPDDEHLYVYTRSLGGEVWLVALNFSANQAALPVNAEGEIILSNYGGAGAKYTADAGLRPYEAVIIRR